MAKLNKTTKILIFILFTLTLGVSLVRPYIPIYLKEELLINVTLIGTIMSLSGFIQYSGTIVTSVILTKVPPKIVFFTGLILRALSYLILLLTLSQFLSLAAILLIAFSATLFNAPNRILIAQEEENNPKSLVKAIGLNGGFLNAGLALAPVIAGFVFYYGTSHPDFNGYKLTYFLALIILIITILAFLRYIGFKEKPHHQDSLKLTINKKDIGTFIIQIFLNSTIVAWFYYFSIYAAVINKHNIIPVFFTLYHLAITLSQIFLSKHISKISRTKIILICYSLSIASSILLWISNNITMLIGGILVGIGFGSLQIKNELDVLQSKTISSSYSLFRFFGGIGISLGAQWHSITLYFTEQSNSIATYWLYTGLFATLALLASLIVIKLDKKYTTNP